MKKLVKPFKSTKATKLGGYNIAVTAVVIAIAIAVNLLVSALPSNLTQYDISSAKLYSITSNTKAVLSHLEDEVTIYWICQTGQEDTIVEKLLDKYAAESDLIKVERKNPDVYPTFAEQYTDGTVYNNDLVVVCGDRYRYISLADIYEYEYYSYYSYDAYFDGEGEITSAIDYVVSDDLPQLYLLTGHNELDLTDTLVSAITKENIEIVDFSLLSTGSVPEEADCVLIYSPETDLSKVEAQILQEYVAGGGKLIVISGPAESEPLDNLDALMEHYCVYREEGVVIEGDSNYYAYSYPYLLLPEIESSEITDAQIEDDDIIVMAVASGFTLKDSVTSVLTGETVNRSDYDVTNLLLTSDDAYSKVAGYAITTYDKEDGDIDGPFALAVSVVDDTEGNEGKAIFISSGLFLEDTYVSYSSDANTDFLLNSIAWMTGETDAISIRSKSLNNEYLSITQAQAATLRFVMLLVIPMIFVAMGLVEVISRKKLLK